MSGFGERFRRAGYDMPKPLIKVDGRPIIDYVVKMFPGETNFLFICNQEHLDTPSYRMAETLERIVPGASIVGIAPHKLGPVHAVLAARAHLAPSGPIVVNYCDFACDWDWVHFKEFVAETGADGCVTCYRGFHPHTIWSTSYAYVRETGLRAYDIQEKQPFTAEPCQEFASSGTYYFARSDLFLASAEEIVARDLRVGGEFYISLVFKPMFANGRKVMVYEVEHFMQWGTPEDLEDYLYWSGVFQAIPKQQPPPRQLGTVMIPMAGLGSRFGSDNYELPKPLIPVSGRPMAVQALCDLPKADSQVFVTRSDLPARASLEEELLRESAAPRFVILDHMTDGQASTCLAGMEAVSRDAPLTIAACDNGMLYDPAGFLSLMDNPDVDVIVWGATGYPGARRRPEMYGWIDADPRTGRISRVSVKQALADPATDPIVVGTFTFKHADDFEQAVARMKACGDRVNGEYYVDAAINHALALGLDCRLFLIDYYLCWGSPQDLRTFDYWQECFHAWSEHPYRKESDRDWSHDRDPNDGGGNRAVKAVAREMVK
jgi:NDP-sugar pyrophosphorylase family protein